MVFIVGITGGSGAGKTTLVRFLLGCIGPHQTNVLEFDSYYRDLAHISPKERKQVNYDHPEALDHEHFIEHLHNLCDGQTVEVPTYDFESHTRNRNKIVTVPREILILDGILLLHFKQIRDLLDLSIFIDINEELRLARRTKRDLKERGRSQADVAQQFRKTVAPMHHQFVQPSLIHADRVVSAKEKLAVVARELAKDIGSKRTREATTQPLR